MNKKNRDLVKLNKTLIKLLTSDPKRHPSLNQKRSRKSRKNLFLAGFFIFLIVSALGLGVVSSVVSRFALLEAFLTMMSTSPFINETNILVVGLDNVEGSHRTDTIMVLHVSPSDKKLYVVAIPRDTILEVPGVGLTKINHAYAFGGINLTRKALQKFFGINIPFTVAINIDGLAKVIDTLGGLTINVEKRMYYVDYAGGLYVDLYPGLQHLNGRQALGYVRFRHDTTGDIGRILRQQKFMRALASKIVAKKDVLSAPRVITSLLSNINTNMGVRQILGLSLSMRQSFDIGNIEMTSVPGEPIMINKVFYMRPNVAEVDRISHDFLQRKIQKKTMVNWRTTNS